VQRCLRSRSLHRLIHSCPRCGTTTALGRDHHDGDPTFLQLVNSKLSSRGLSRQDVEHGDRR
jgi:hypothetical protein